MANENENEEFDGTKFIEGLEDESKPKGGSGENDDDDNGDKGDKGDKGDGGNGGAGNGSDGDDKGDGGESDDQLTFEELETKQKEFDDQQNKLNEEANKKKLDNETDDEKEKRIAAENQAKLDEEAKKKIAGEGKSGTVPKELYTELSLKEDETPEAVVEKVRELKKKNEELEARLKPSPMDEDINRFKDVVKMTDRELCVKELTIQGVAKEDAEAEVDKKDPTAQRVQATLIRNNINKHIEGLELKKVEENKKNQAMLQNDLNISQTELKKHISQQKTMFGLKLAKEDSELPKVHDDDFNYIVSGQFMRELTESPEGLYEASRFFRKRAVMKKALESKGINKGVESVLKTMKNAELPRSSKAVINTGGEEEFNIGNFMRGEE